MASTKGPKVVGDKRKRKSDVNENETRTKRQRAAAKDKLNGLKSGGAGETNGQLLPVNGVSEDHHESLSGQELIRGFHEEHAGWRISKPMGGRMLDIDPILSKDEQYMIITYNTSIQVYSTVDSLLVRRIPISAVDASESISSAPASIVATRKSSSNPDLLWVACSDGRIYQVDWTQQQKDLEYLQTVSRTAKAMTVGWARVAEEDVDIVFVTESEKHGHMDLVSYLGVTGRTTTSHKLMSLNKPTEGNSLYTLESNKDQAIVGSFNDEIFAGKLAQQRTDSLDKLQYNLFSFVAPDLITCTDVRTATRKSQGGRKHNQSSTEAPIDVICGGARGGIYRYQDMLARAQTQTNDGPALHAQKFHWHRKAVHTLKWSRDGHYMLSGGSENVLVVWQVDTAQRDYLPHLAGSIENIVVSTSGSSYVLHLDDNSAMVISTTEMKPTAYISGIQSAAVDISIPKDMLVQRVWTPKKHVQRPIPAAIRPKDPSKLHVCVGNGRQATMSGEFSAPLLQSFDLETFSSVSKQALARTQPTDVNITNKGSLIDEPLVTHIAFSADGKWLASVDDWTPPARDIDSVVGDLKDQLTRERHETYLKFWDVRNDDSFALVSRVNSPHTTSHAETVLDLAADPVASGFATIGTDGVVRLWRPRVRQQGGVTVKENGQDVYSWSCSHVIAVGDGIGRDTVVGVSDVSPPASPQGRVTFSEDGSTVFAAFGALNSGAVHVIDAASGNIIKTLEGMWSGRLQAIRALSPFIITLSDELRVFDVVGDELRYGIVVPQIPGVTELLQLAVDYTSGHFAVALPVGEVSSVGVFDPDEPEPLLVRSIPHRIVSLISAPDASGFIALDDSAQIWVIAEGSDPSSVTAARPLQDVHLEHISGDLSDERSTALMEDVDMGSDDEGAGADAEPEDVDMDDIAHPTVLHQQQLADIFDAAPAFAAPSVEEMFYKVTSLLSSEPLTQS